MKFSTKKLFENIGKGYAGFQDQCIQPLCHSSGAKIVRLIVFKTKYVFFLNLK